MARLHHVKKARKDNPVCKKGEDYYWWQFAFSSKRYSKTKPSRSTYSTQSAFLGGVMDIEDNLSSRFEGLSSSGEFLDVLNEIAQEVRELGEQCQESLDNMPEQLQYAPTGELLQERIDGCEEWADQIESVDCDMEEDESVEQEIKVENKIEEIISEIANVNPGMG